MVEGRHSADHQHQHDKRPGQQNPFALELLLKLVVGHRQELLVRHLILRSQMRFVTKFETIKKYETIETMGKNSSPGSQLNFVLPCMAFETIEKYETIGTIE